MNVGLCTISDKERPVAEVIELAADVGYDSVEIWGREHVSGRSEKTCRAIRGMVEQNDLRSRAYGSYLRPGTDRFEDRLAHEVFVADWLGADLIRVWAGRGSYADAEAEDLDRVVRDLREASERASEVGVEVTVEKHANTLTDTPMGAREVIERVDHPNCGLNYQPDFSISMDEISREVAELGPLTNHCHLQAVRERGSSQRSPLSEAFYDVEGLLKGLRHGGYEEDVMIEFVTDERPYCDAIAADLEYLRSLA